MDKRKYQIILLLLLLQVAYGLGADGTGVEMVNPSPTDGDTVNAIVVNISTNASIANRYFTYSNLNSDLIYAWFNGTLLDYSGFNHNLTVSGADNPLISDGWYGKSLRINETTTVAMYGAGNITDGGQNTLIVHMKTDGTLEDNQAYQIFGHRSGNNGHMVNLYHASSGDVIRVYTYSGNTTGLGTPYLSLPANVLDDGNWHWLAYRANADYTFNAWLDCVKDAETPTLRPNWVLPGTISYIGNPTYTGSANNMFFDAYIVYDRAMPDEFIEGICNQTVSSRYYAYSDVMAGNYTLQAFVNENGTLANSSKITINATVGAVSLKRSKLYNASNVYYWNVLPAPSVVNDSGYGNDEITSSTNRGTVSYQDAFNASQWCGIYGDSITNTYYVPNLDSNLNSQFIGNGLKQGVGGNTCAQVLTRLQSDCTTKNQSIILQCGTNDLTGNDVATVKQRLIDIFEWADTLNISIYFIGQSPYNAHAEKAKNLSDWEDDYWENNNSLGVMKAYANMMFDLSSGNNGTYNPDYSADGVHPTTEAGKIAYANSVWEHAFYGMMFDSFQTVFTVPSGGDWTLTTSLMNPYGFTSDFSTTFNYHTPSTATGGGGGAGCIGFTQSCSNDGECCNPYLCIDNTCQLEETVELTRDGKTYDIKAIAIVLAVLIFLIYLMVKK